MNPGQLNSRITIQQPVTGQDEIGQPLTTWQPLATVWANIRLMGGLESIKADAQTATTKASIRIRYREDVSTSMQISHKATLYKITALLPDMQRKAHVDLVCEVIV